MKKEQLLEIQKMEYEALVAIDEICKKNNLEYFLRGGSALGAVRHNGFIPWDDDIDIALPRKDYLKLIQIMPREFNDRFQFISYQKTKNAHCYFPRILLNEDIRGKKGLPTNNERGLVLIDVLPLDGIPDGVMARKIFIFKVYFYRMLASLWTFDIKETVSKHGNKKDIVIKFLRAIKIHHLYKQDTIYKKLDKLYEKNKYGETRDAGILSGSKIQKEIVPTDWWGSGTYKIFNELKVKVPLNYDSYLKHLFGDDYMTNIPKPEERTKSHFYEKLEQE